MVLSVPLYRGLCHHRVAVVTTLRNMRGVYRLVFLFFLVVEKNDL